MRLYWFRVSSNPMTVIYIRRRKFGHRHMGEMLWNDMSTNQRTPKIAVNHQTLEEKA